MVRIFFEVLSCALVLAILVGILAYKMFKPIGKAAKKRFDEINDEFHK